MEKDTRELNEKIADYITAQLPEYRTRQISDNKIHLKNGSAEFYIERNAYEGGLETWTAVHTKPVIYADKIDLAMTAALAAYNKEVGFGAKRVVNPGTEHLPKDFEGFDITYSFQNQAGPLNSTELGDFFNNGQRLTCALEKVAADNYRKPSDQIKFAKTYVDRS